METSDDKDFVRQLRTAMAHLYDFAFLQRHPLALRLVPPHVATAHTRGRALRRILLDALETLNPGPSVAIRAPEQRPYAVLFALYVEGKSEDAVAAELGVVARQVRRDRASALRALAGVLRDRCLPDATEDEEPLSSEPLREESWRLAQGREPVDVHELVQGLLPLLERMAGGAGVAVAGQVSADLPRPNLNRTLARQVLIGLSSQALKSPYLSRLTFDARHLEGAVAVGLRLQYRPAAAPGERHATELAPLETLAVALGARLQQEHLGDGEAVWLIAPLQDDIVVLVVDDNRDLFALFERYVAGMAYRLVHAAGADEALALARAQRPQAITVDLMMPNRDGWELLQALRTDPLTAAIPIIVCSVLEQPELALSLGVRGYLKKPVRQAEFLQALQAAREAAPAGAGHRGSPAST